MESLLVPGILDSLENIRKFVSAFAEKAQLGKSASYKLILAVDELATNSIVHGYTENNIQGDINIIAEITAEELIITIEDTAPAYDPRSHEIPDCQAPCKPLDERALGGLGVFLVLKDIDRYDYEWINKTNRSILAMKLGKGTP